MYASALCTPCLIAFEGSSYHMVSNIKVFTSSLFSTDQLPRSMLSSTFNLNIIPWIIFLLGSMKGRSNWVTETHFCAIEQQLVLTKCYLWFHTSHLTFLSDPENLKCIEKRGQLWRTFCYTLRWLPWWKVYRLYIWSHRWAAGCVKVALVKGMEPERVTLLYHVCVTWSFTLQTYQALPGVSPCRHFSTCLAASPNQQPHLTSPQFRSWSHNLIGG